MRHDTVIIEHISDGGFVCTCGLVQNVYSDWPKLICGLIVFFNNPAEGSLGRPDIKVRKYVPGDSSPFTAEELFEITNNNLKNLTTKKRGRSHEKNENIED